MIMLSGGRNYFLNPPSHLHLTEPNGRYQTQLQGKTRAGSLALFSSTGPAPDGRIEPDLVAPGYSPMRRREFSRFLSPPPAPI